MNEKENKLMLERKTRASLRIPMADLTPRKLSVKQQDAVKGGRGDRLADKFP